MQQMIFIADLTACSTCFGAPLCPSSGTREYYTDGFCLWYLVLWFSSCRYGVELSVMCPVCRLLEHSKCFGRFLRPSSGVLRTLVAATLGYPYWIYIITTHGLHQWLLLQFLVLVMMDAESVRTMYSNLAVTNKQYCQSCILLVLCII